MFRFTRAQMGGVEQEVAGLKREGYKLLEGARSSGYGAAPALQYEPTRGCHLNFRSTTVKLVGMKMFGIGTATGLVAAAGLANDSTRSCALGCAINYVAAYFYFLIYTVRRQGWVGGPFGLGMLRPQTEVDDEATTAQRLFVQEAACDGFRQTDWTCTVSYAHSNPPALGRTPRKHLVACVQLVLMALETDTLVHKLNGGRRSAPIGPLWSAVMQPLMVQCGTFARVYLNNLRSPPGDPTLVWEAMLGGGLWALALVSFCFTTWSVLDHIGPLDEYADATGREEARALVILAWIQVIYPIVSVVDFVWMHLYKARYERSGVDWRMVYNGFSFNEYSARLSTFKDVMYGFSDVCSKGGLSLIAFLLATRV